MVTEHQTTGSTLPRSPLLRRAWVTPPPAARATELVTDLDFDANGNGEVNTGDTYWNDGSGWLPIGARSVTFGSRENKPFLASFHGNDHTISNLYIARNGTDYLRLSRSERIRWRRGRESPRFAQHGLRLVADTHDPELPTVATIRVDLQDIRSRVIDIDSYKIFSRPPILHGDVVKVVNIPARCGRDHFGRD